MVVSNVNVLHVKCTSLPEPVQVVLEVGSLQPDIGTIQQEVHLLTERWDPAAVWLSCIRSMNRTTSAVPGLQDGPASMTM